MSSKADSDEYPSQGVQLCVLKGFLRDACDKYGLDYLTMSTAEFCAKVVLPETQNEKCALIQKLDPGKVVDVATVFVSHAWSGRIWETLSAVEEQSGIQAENQFVWIDCCSVNQHQVASRSAEWYSSTFHTAIKRIGLTCLVLAPIMSPTPLKRSWCLWELYGTLHTSTPLKICVPSSEKKILLDTMRSDFLQIMSNICNVDASKAEAFHKEDRDRIREAIDSSVGITRINEAALDPLREWLLTTATEAISSGSDPELYRGLGLLRFDLGRIDAATEAFREAIRLRKDVLRQDPTNDSIKVSMAGDLTNLASCFLEKGDAKEALTLYSESLDQRIAANEKDLALAYNNKGLALKALRRYSEALKCFDQGMEHAKMNSTRIDAEENIQVNRAELLRESGRPEEARRILTEILETKKARLGGEHVTVAQVMNLLGQSLVELHKFDEAEAIYSEALRIRTRALGKYHPRVGIVIGNLADLEYRRGNFEKAKTRYNQLLELQKQTFNADHPFVKETERLRDRMEMLNRPSVAYQIQGPRIHMQANYLFSLDLPDTHQQAAIDQNPVTPAQMSFGMDMPYMNHLPVNQNPVMLAQMPAGMDLPRSHRIGSDGRAPMLGRALSMVEMVSVENTTEESKIGRFNPGLETSVSEFVIPSWNDDQSSQEKTGNEAHVNKPSSSKLELNNETTGLNAIAVEKKKEKENFVSVRVKPTKARQSKNGGSRCTIC